MLTFGDDGEKFGTWPDTKSHVYEDGWLRSFFDALTENAQWLHTVTLGEAIRRTPPAGKVYLPDCSYREMTEWSLPVEAQETFDDVVHAMENHQRWSDLKSFVRGGYWRNFKTKYDETNEMYARMMHVSRRLAEAEASGLDAGELAVIRDHLYRGQCNCPYWHGAFGGIYLPHLRNAIYYHLIEADTRLDRITAEPMRAPFKRRRTTTTSTDFKKSGSATTGCAPGSRRDKVAASTNWTFVTSVTTCLPHCSEDRRAITAKFWPAQVSAAKMWPASTIVSSSSRPIWINVCNTMRSHARV